MKERRKTEHVVQQPIELFLRQSHKSKQSLNFTYYTNCNPTRIFELNFFRITTAAFHTSSTVLNVLVVFTRTYHCDR